MTRKLIRLKRLREEKFDGMSEGGFWELRQRERDFPKPINVSSHTVAFWEDEIDNWLEARREISAVRG